MCATLNKLPEKDSFQLTLIEIDKSIEEGNRILKKLIKINKNSSKK